MGSCCRISDSTLSWSYVPFLYQRNPSGLVFMCWATSLSVNCSFPVMRIWLMEIRIPSTTWKTICTEPSACGNSLTVVTAWKYPLSA